jgi:hypothetical protein
VRYKLWQQGRGWDRVSTEVTFPAEGSSGRPAMLPSSPDAVSVLFTRLAGGQAAFMERRRDLNPVPITAVATPAVPLLPRLHLAPNPIHIGSAVVVRGISATSAQERLEVLDLAGRRVSVAPLEYDGDRWTARLSAAETGRWRSGIYFVRLEHGRGGARLVVLN